MRWEPGTERWLKTVAVPTAPAWLPRAGLGADVMGTGARPRGSEGGGHVHVVYAPGAVTFAGIGVRRVHLTNFSLFFAVLVCLACLVVAVFVLTRGDDEHA